MSSFGWDLSHVQHLRANIAGFVAHRDIVLDETAVALIGDSYVEAAALDEANRPGPQLERLLPVVTHVYAPGGPGSSLLDYAERMRFASKRYGVRDFVVFAERSDVVFSQCGSGNIHSPCVDPVDLSERVEKQPPAGLLKRLALRSALAQYVFSQLGLSVDRLVRQAILQSRPVTHSSPVSAATAAAAPDPRTLQVADRVTALFFARAKPHVAGRLVLVVDSDRARSLVGNKASDSARARFIDLARAAEATVVDMEPAIDAHFADSSLSLNVGPRDAHLNKLRVALPMRAAAEALERPTRR